MKTMTSVEKEETIDWDKTRERGKDTDKQSRNDSINPTLEAVMSLIVTEEK